MSPKGGGSSRSSQAPAPQHNRPGKSTVLYVWDDVAYWIGIALSKGIPWAGVVGVFWQLRLTVAALAGQQTDASILMKFMADVRADQYIAYIFGAGGITYGAFEHALRRTKERRMGKRLKELEEKLDPSRTSSTEPRKLDS